MNVNKRLFTAGDRVAVALSGGKDSVVLFDYLCKHEKELGIEVLVINIEHGIRGEASVADSEFVKNLCDNARKRRLFYNINVPDYADKNGLGLEQAARELRYECFFRAIEEGLCDKIATAHHAADNAESVFLNVLRGSGLKGLCGISETAYGGKVVRPMLSVLREEIDAYAKENALVYVTDESNFDDTYSRNFLRNKVFPLIKTRYPDLEDSLLRLSSICRGDYSYISAAAESLVRIKDGEICVSVESGIDEHLFANAVVLAMAKAGLEKDYETIHVKAFAALADAPAGTGVDLPHGFRADRDYDSIVIYKKTDEIQFEFPFAAGEYDLPCGYLKIENFCLPKLRDNEKVPFFAQQRARGIIYINKNCVKDAVVRSRRIGDTFRKFGGGQCSLKEYLIDCKVPRRQRNLIPVCAVNGNVIFIGGMEISKCAAVCGGETDVYKITYEKRFKEI